MNPTALLAALAGLPRLTDARCRGQHHLFDMTADGSVPGLGGAAQVATARTQALAICKQCPALAGCRAWADTQRPRDLPLGVIAGRIHLGRGRMTDDPTHTQKVS